MRKAILGAVLLMMFSGSAQATPIFPTILSGNTTDALEAVFLGAPDDVFLGLGHGDVTYDFGANWVLNRPGLVDLNVYEVDWGGPEFNLMDVLVSTDGIAWTSIKGSETAIVRILGDSAHGNDAFARSYDLGAFSSVRYVRIDGLGEGEPGGTVGFDLDAIGAHDAMAVSVIPDPGSTLLLLGIGLAGLRSWRKRLG
jgi:hypothetical protein